MEKLIANRFQVIEKYKLNNPSGTVIRAFDTGLKRTVILKGEPVSKSIKTRAESQALVKITSKYVVNQYDLIINEDMLYMVIEYYSGDTLSDLMMRHKKLDASRALPIALCLLQAMIDINSAGYLYRDLNWKHISYRNRNELKVYDLGEVILCAPGCIVSNPHAIGTWETMAPEEFVVSYPVDNSFDKNVGKKDNKVNSWADPSIYQAANVYSVACLIYSLFAGYYPLDYKRFIPNWRNVLKEEDEKNAQYKLHCSGKIDFSPIPTNITSVLAKALLKNPKSRYQTVTEFKKDLFVASKY